jgi:hypothetical protein
MLSRQTVLIVGAQRSGTTLTRLILEAHPSFVCYDEVTSYEVLAGQRPLLADPRRPVFKIPRFTEQIDKTPWEDAGAPTASIRYDGQPMLFLLRDPRDVVASMLHLQDGAWYDAHIVAILEARAARDADFAGRWLRDRAWAQSTPSPRTAICALYWSYKTEALERYQAAGFPVFPLRYEELVQKPESVLRKVLSWLDEPWDAGVLTPHRAAHREIGADGLTVGQTDPEAPIHDGSVGAWRAALDPAEVDIVNAATLHLASKHEADETSSVLSRT